MNILSPHFLDGYVKHFRLGMIILKKGTYVFIRIIIILSTCSVFPCTEKRLNMKMSLFGKDKYLGIGVMLSISKTRV